MKITFITFIFSIVSSSAFAGVSFCRTIEDDGFRNNNLQFEHCIELSGGVLEDGAGILTDNANSYVGKPPETLNYLLIEGKLYIDDPRMNEAYRVEVVNNRYQITAIGDAASVEKGVSFLLDYDSVGDEICYTDPSYCLWLDFNKKH